MKYIFLLPLIFFACINKQVQPDPIPPHDSIKLFSKKLDETRIINIWLPPEYKTTKKSFPVLYMPDGGLKEDFPHIANTIAKLVKEKKIPPIILVGIENTKRGRDLTGASQEKADEEYCPLTDGAKNFRAFIEDELITEIEKRYRTTDYKGIIGESLAGLFVVETFLKEPQLFNFYIAFDPSLWWNNHNLVRNTSTYLEHLPDRKTKLWFAGSSAPDISEHTKTLSAILRKNTPKLEWKYVDEPNEKHHTIFRADKEKALIWSLNN